MKIALIGQKGIPAKQGGVEKHTEALSTRLAKAGFDVSVYSRPHYTGNNKKSYKGVKIINLPSINTKHLDAITHTFLSSTHAIFQNYDIIHYHGVGPSLLSWIPRLFNPRTKVITTFHCVDRQHQKWGLFARIMLELGEKTACYFAHETIVVSKTIQKYCKFRFDKNTVYIPNGVDRQTAKTDKSDILKKHGLKKGNYITTISRLVAHKGIHTLIEAYQKTNTDKKLVIVGGSSNTDDYQKYLKGLAKDNKNIIFTGQQTGKNLKALYQNAYLFVQPSEAEGLSIALLEAISYNTPVLASDIAENSEIVNGIGLEFKNKNIKDLVKKINFAIKNPQLIKQLSNKAKKRTNKEYNWDDIVEQTIELYRRPALGKLTLVSKRS